MTRLDGKRAIVTGASSGIGAATVAALRAEGARVAGGARRVGEVDADVALELDVTDRGSSQRFVEVAVRELGGVDILVNSAGLALGRAPFDESSEEDEQVVIDTNVKGLMRMTRLCLPHIRDGGHIVNLGSTAGRWAYAGGAVYCASKAAVDLFTRGLREDLLGRAIRLTNVEPGMVRTDFSLVRFKGDEQKAAAVYADVAMGGPLQADDVVDCIMFALTRPPHANVDEIMLTALGQTTGLRVLRTSQ